MDQALNSQKTPHTSPLRASYGMSFVSILMKNDRVIKGFYCIYMYIATHQESQRRHDVMRLLIGHTQQPVASGVEAHGLDHLVGVPW